MDPVSDELIKAIQMLDKTMAQPEDDPNDDNASFFKSMTIKSRRLTSDNQLIFQQAMLAKYAELIRQQNAPPVQYQQATPSTPTNFHPAIYQQANSGTPSNFQQQQQSYQYTNYAPSSLPQNDNTMPPPTTPRSLYAQL